MEKYGVPDAGCIGRTYPGFVVWTAFYGNAIHREIKRVAPSEELRKQKQKEEELARSLARLVEFCRKLEAAEEHRRRLLGEG